MFSDYLSEEKIQALEGYIYSASKKDVLIALKKTRLNIEDFCALISPAADPFIEQMANKSKDLTLRRFGKVVQLFAPMYLSNECSNVCTYCGFSFGNKIARKTLSESEIIKEAQAVKDLGFEHILLVTGESKDKVGIDYIVRAVELVAPYFANISIEVQPLSKEEYQRLHLAGVHSVLVYQETYDQQAYKKHHLKGKKANFSYRLNTPDRIGQSGMHKIGLGVLLGLSDWRVDAAVMAQHLSYLEKKYWSSKFSISFPRLRPAEGLTHVEYPTTERDVVNLITAFRLWNENLELSLSTRESPAFRQNVFPLGITTMSAGSKTEPGGYALNSGALKQFEIDDSRSPDLVAKMITQSGYEPVWKDWDNWYEKRTLCQANAAA